MIRKVTLLSALYFAQGLPYGFQSNALGNFLYKGGMSKTAVTLLGLLAAPWLFKALWSPLVDRHGSLTFGRRKSWIVPLQGLMGLCCVLAAFTSPKETITPLLVLIFLLNLFAATQDIAVDGLTVSLLDEKELGWGNAIQVVGYKVGMLMGGGFLVSLSARIGWNGMFFAMAALCWGVMANTYFFDERSSTEQPKERLHVKDVFLTLKKALALPGTVWLLVFVASYKVGEVMAEKVFSLFVIDHGITPETLGEWFGTYGTVASLSGSLLGGVLASRWRLLPAVGVTAALRVLPLAIQWALTAGVIPFSQTNVIAINCTEHFFAGALTTAMFAFMMSKVDRKIGATHYTLLASVEVLGKMPGGLLSGKVADATSYATVNAFATIASLLFLLLLIPMTLAAKKAPSAA
ncbi:MAG: MFS transporter [Myxococcaceae bacterium]